MDQLYHWYPCTFSVNTTEYDKEIKRNEEIDDGLFEPSDSWVQNLIKYEPFSDCTLIFNRNRQGNSLRFHGYSIDDLESTGIYPISGIYIGEGVKKRVFMIPVFGNHNRGLNLVTSFAQSEDNINLGFDLPYLENYTTTGTFTYDDLFPETPIPPSPTFTPLPPPPPPPSSFFGSPSTIPPSVGSASTIPPSIGSASLNHSTLSNGSSSGLILSSSQSSIGSASTIPPSVEDDE